MVSFLDANCQHDREVRKSSAVCVEVTYLYHCLSLIQIKSGIEKDESEVPCSA